MTGDRSEENDQLGVFDGPQWIMKTNCVDVDDGS
jgi:hypothetical protein